MPQQGDEYSLLHKVKVGDKVAFASLYHSHVQRLCLISYKITGDKGVAEDVVQDFFVAFWQKKDRLSFTTSFGAYASRSVYNASLNVIRQTKKVVALEEAAVVFDAADFLEEDNLTTYRERLNLAIEKLPPQRRKIFEKICINGSSYADVAETFGISVNTVKVHMSKAYRTLREELNLDTAVNVGIIVLFLS